MFSFMFVNELGITHRRDEHTISDYICIHMGANNLCVLCCCELFPSIDSHLFLPTPTHPFILSSDHTCKVMSQNQLHPPRISRRPSNWTKSFNEAQKCDPEQAQLREDRLNKLWQEHQGVLKVEAMITSSLEGVKQTETEGAVVFYEDEELAFTEVNELLSHLTAEQRKRLAKIIKKVVEPEAADLATRTGGMKMHEKFPPKISEVPKWVKLKKTTPMRKETDKKQNNRKKRIDKVIGRGKKREKETTPKEDATMVSMGTDGAIGGLKSDDEGESSQTEKGILSSLHFPQYP